MAAVTHRIAAVENERFGLYVAYDNARRSFAAPSGWRERRGLPVPRHYPGGRHRDGPCRTRTELESPCAASLTASEDVTGHTTAMVFLYSVTAACEKPPSQAAMYAV